MQGKSKHFLRGSLFSTVIVSQEKLYFENTKNK